jgi:hypothetical protein
MMTTKNKAVTQLVQSMKKSLKNEHAHGVPYSALKASYLRANGEHPHAFASRDLLTTELDRLKTLVAQAPSFFSPEHDFDGKKLAWLEKAGLCQPTPAGIRPVLGYTLYLAHDEIGCLQRMSLDPMGQYLVPDDWLFPPSAQVLSLYSEVPCVKRYELPEYIAFASGFFENTFGLKLSSTYTSQYKDLGDDSGDSATLQMKMCPADWLALAKAVAVENEDFNEVLSGWVELPGVALGDMPKEKQDLCLDFIKVILSDPLDSNWVCATFEWVYPDEDSDSRSARINRDTGAILIAEHFEHLEELGVTETRVRSRLVLDEDYDSAITPAYRTDDETGRGYFKLDKKGLISLNTFLVEQDS